MGEFCLEVSVGRGFRPLRVACKRFKIDRHSNGKRTYPRGMRCTLVVIECHGANGT